MRCLESVLSCLAIMVSQNRTPTMPLNSTSSGSQCQHISIEGKKKKCRIRTHISSDIAFVSGALEISISHPLSHVLAATAVFSLKTSQLYFVWV